MENKTSLLLILLPMLIIFAASSDAVPTSSIRVPTSRRLGMFNDKELVYDLLDIKDIKDTGGDSQQSKFQGILQRRMDMETMDYGQTGSNPRHLPGSPGKN